MRSPQEIEADIANSEKQFCEWDSVLYKTSDFVAGRLRSDILVQDLFEKEESIVGE